MNSILGTSRMGGIEEKAIRAPLLPVESVKKEDTANCVLSSYDVLILQRLRQQDMRLRKFRNQHRCLH